MKGYTHLMLTPYKGLLAFNAPNRDAFFGFDNVARYQEAVKQSIKEGRYFGIKTMEARAKELVEDQIGKKMEFNKPYEVPTGYEVKIEKKYKSFQDSNPKECAIIVPKEKTDFEKISKLSNDLSEHLKTHSSIEETAEALYPKGEDEFLNSTRRKYFIAGAKSQNEKLVNLLQEQLEIHRKMIPQSKTAEEQYSLLKACDMLSYIRILIDEKIK